MKLKRLLTAVAALGLLAGAMHTASATEVRDKSAASAANAFAAEKITSLIPGKPVPEVGIGQKVESDFGTFYHSADEEKLNLVQKPFWHSYDTGTKAADYLYRVNTKEVEPAKLPVGDMASPDEANPDVPNPDVPNSDAPGPDAPPIPQ